MSHVLYYYRQRYVTFEQRVGGVTSYRELRNSTWLTQYYAHGLILNYLVADMVWHGFSCNRKLFVTLGLADFRTLYLVRM